MKSFQILPDQPAVRPNPPARGKWPALLQQLLDAGLRPGVVKTVKVQGGDVARALACAGLKKAAAWVGQGQCDEGWPQWYVNAWPHPKEVDLIQVEMIEGVRPKRGVRDAAE